MCLLLVYTNTSVCSNPKASWIIFQMWLIICFKIEIMKYIIRLRGEINLKMLCWTGSWWPASVSASSGSTSAWGELRVETWEPRTSTTTTGCSAGTALTNSDQITIAAWLWWNCWGKLLHYWFYCSNGFIEHHCIMYSSSSDMEPILSLSVSVVCRIMFPNLLSASVCYWVTLHAITFSVCKLKLLRMWKLNYSIH